MHKTSRNIPAPWYTLCLALSPFPHIAEHIPWFTAEDVGTKCVLRCGNSRSWLTFGKPVFLVYAELQHKYVPRRPTTGTDWTAFEATQNRNPMDIRSECPTALPRPCILDEAGVSGGLGAPSPKTLLSEGPARGAKRTEPEGSTGQTDDDNYLQTCAGAHTRRVSPP